MYCDGEVHVWRVKVWEGVCDREEPDDDADCAGVAEV